MSQKLEPMAQHDEPLHVIPANANIEAWTFSSPPHWQRKRLRMLCELNPAVRGLKDIDDDIQVSFLPMELAKANSPDFRTGTLRLADVANGFTPFRDGDLLIAKITPCFENGKGGIASRLLNGIGFGSTEFHVLRPGPEIDVRFLYYATISQPFRDVGSKMMKGSAGQKRVPAEFLSSFMMPYPSIREQRSIAGFLDHSCWQVNRLIYAKRRQIRLLNEQKQVIINQAVTQGLDPNVRMKPSGVEWLGDVPEHWAVVRSHGVFSERVERGFESEPLLSVTIEHGVIRQEELLRITSKKDLSNMDKSNYKLVQAGDIAYNKMRMWQGSVGRSAYRGIVSPAYVVIYPRQSSMANTLYYHYLFRTPAFMCESYRNSYGICDDQLSLRYEDFKTIRIPVPPVAEQSQIAQFVQKVDTQTDRLIGRIRLQIEFLQEYRTRLVADVVTGKLDVRDVELLDVDVMEGFDERYEEERLEQEEMMEAEEMDVDENN